MKHLLKRIFLEHWQRKGLSLLLATITWFVVNHSMTSTKTLNDIPIKVINLPPGKTIEGLQLNNVLKNRISLTLTGNKHVIDELNSKDLEVIIDASNKEEEWIASISKKNLISFNPDIDIMQTIHRIEYNDFIIQLSPLLTEHIPVYIVTSQEDLPPGYELLGIWPHELYVTLSGAEKTIKELKKTGILLNINLNTISQKELLSLKREGTDQILSFFIPNTWKFIKVPILSASPIAIDDPRASLLRIDFIQKEMIPLEMPIPIQLFSSSQTLSTFPPDEHPFMSDGCVEKKNGVYFYTSPLFIRGVPSSFLQMIKDRLELLIFPSQGSFTWTIEPRGWNELVQKYTQEEAKTYSIPPPEEYFIDRFQKLIHSLRYYQADQEPLRIEIELKEQKIFITSKQHPSP